MRVKQSKGDIIQYCVIASIILLSLAASSVIFDLSTRTILIFLLLNALSIFLPGFAVWRIIHFGRNFSKVTRICLIYALGYALIVVQYFASELTDRIISFQHITLFVALLSVGIIIYDIRKSKIDSDSTEDGTNYDEWTGIVTFALFLGLSVFAYSANFLSPEVKGIFSASRDMVYWGNNSAALKIAFPANNLFFLGSPLNYHYFSNIPIAFLSDVYGLDVFSLSFPLYSLTKSFILVGSALALLEAIGVHKSIKVVGIAALLFMTGAEDVSGITLIHHTLLAPFGCDIGLGYGLMFVSALIIQWNKISFDQRIVGAALIFWFMCVGSKGPVAIVFMVAPGILCLCSLFRKEYAFAFGYGIPVLLIFYAVSKYCLGLFNVIGEDDATFWRLSFYDLEDIATIQVGSDALWRKIATLVQGNLFLAVLAKLIAASPAIFFGLIVSTAACFLLMRRKRISVREMILFLALSSASLIGMLLWLVIDAGGQSEMYFAMAAKYTECAAIIYLLKLYLRESIVFSAAMKRIEVAIATILIFLVAFGVLRYMFFGYKENGALVNTAEGISCLMNRPAAVPDGNSIGEAVYEGLAWIRDHSSSDAVVLSDRAVIEDDAAYYCYRLFSERQQYVEGTNMLPQTEVMREEIERRANLSNRAYENDRAAIDELRQEGIDYILSTKDITPQFDGSACGVTLVFENDAIAVYRM